MNSVWLSCDYEPMSMQIRSCPTQTPVYGVFLQDPSIIGEWIPRPHAPFHLLTLISETCKTDSSGSEVLSDCEVVA